MARGASPPSVVVLLYSDRGVIYTPSASGFGKRVFTGKPEAVLPKIAVPRDAEVVVLLGHDLFSAKVMPFKVDNPPQEAVRLNLASELGRSIDSIVAAYTTGSKGYLFTYVAERDLIEKIVKGPGKKTPKLFTFPNLLAVYLYWRNKKNLVGNGIWIHHDPPYANVFVTEDGYIRWYWRCEATPEEMGKVLHEALENTPRPPGKPLFSVVHTNDPEIALLAPALSEEGFDAVVSEGEEEYELAYALGTLNRSALEGYWNLTSPSVVEGLKPPSLTPTATRTLVAGAVLSGLMFLYGNFAVSDSARKLAQVQARVQELEAQLGRSAGIQQEIRILEDKLKRYEGAKAIASEKSWPVLEKIASALAPDVGLESFSYQSGRFSGTMIAPNSGSRSRAVKELKKAFSLTLGGVSFGEGEVQSVSIQGVKK